MIPKRYSIRHKTLELLSELYLDINDKTEARIINANEFNLPVVVVANKLNISETYLKKCCVPLVFEKEIEYSIASDSDEEVMRVGVNGLRSYVDKKYLLAGQKLRLDTIYDYFRLASGILLLCIALWTFISNIVTTRQNQNKIMELQQQVKHLQNEIKSSK